MATLANRLIVRTSRASNNAGDAHDYHTLSDRRMQGYLKELDGVQEQAITSDAGQEKRQEAEAHTTRLPLHQRVVGLMAEVCPVQGLLWSLIQHTYIHVHAHAPRRLPASRP